MVSQQQEASPHAVNYILWSSDGSNSGKKKASCYETRCNCSIKQCNGRCGSRRSVLCVLQFYTEVSKMAEESYVLGNRGGIINSYILYKLRVTKPISHLQYRREIILSLCSTIPVGNVRRQMIRSLPDEERFQGRHYLDSGTSHRRCLVCGTAKSNQRKSTVFFCKTCSNYPPLHSVPCFEKYRNCRHLQ